MFIIYIWNNVVNMRYWVPCFHPPVFRRNEFNRYYNIPPDWYIQLSDYQLIAYPTTQLPNYKTTSSTVTGLSSIVNRLSWYWIT